MAHVLSVARALAKLSESDRRVAIGFARELAGRAAPKKARKPRRSKEELAAAGSVVKKRKHPVSENVEEG